MVELPGWKSNPQPVGKLPTRSANWRTEDIYKEQWKTKGGREDANPLSGDLQPTRPSANSHI